VRDGDAAGAWQCPPPHLRRYALAVVSGHRDVAEDAVVQGAPVLVFAQPRVVLNSKLLKRFGPVLHPARVPPHPAAKNMNPARNAGPYGRASTARPVGRATGEANVIGREVANGVVSTLPMVNPPSARATFEWITRPTPSPPAAPDGEDGDDDRQVGAWPPGWQCT